MPFTILPVSTDDAADLSQVMMRAFSRDPHWALLWSSMPLEDIITDNTNRLRRNIINGRDQKRHQKAVDPVTGEVVGPVDWLEAQVPEPNKEDREGFERNYSQYTVDGKIKGLNYEIMTALSPLLEDTEEEILKTAGPCLVLDYICTAPHYQDRGVGSDLVRSGIKVAEDAGLKCYVMSTPAGLRLCESHGFKRVKTIVQDDSKWGSVEPHVNYFLVREVSRPMNTESKPITSVELREIEK
ncbi:hypothetical protein IFR05_010793 [Cadophora sp. M221]|nr:hypothetical protein IFR05_010793 [Cadophora sp. M221]